MNTLTRVIDLGWTLTVEQLDRQRGLAVRDAYRGACAVTGEHSNPVLEAAHIVLYGREG